MKKGETIKGLTFFIVLAALFFVVYLVLGYISNSNVPNVTPGTTPKEGFENKKHTNTINKNQGKTNTINKKQGKPINSIKNQGKPINSNKKQEKHRY